MTKTSKKEPQGKKANNVVEMGGNIDGLYETIREQKDIIDQAKLERKEANSKIKAAKEKLETLGLPKIAQNFAFTYVDLTAEQKQGVDDAQIILREACGQKMKTDQIDMFKEKDETAEG